MSLVAGVTESISLICTLLCTTYNKYSLVFVIKLVSLHPVLFHFMYNHINILSTRVKARYVNQKEGHHRKRRGSGIIVLDL